MIQNLIMIVILRKISILCGLLISFAGMTQDKKVEALEKKLREPVADTIKINVLGELVAQLKYVDTTKAISYGIQMEATAKRLGDPRFLASAYRIKAVLAESYSRHSTALEYCFDGLELLGKRNDGRSQETRACLEYEIGNIFLNQFNIASAMLHYYEALNYFENRKHKNTTYIYLLNRLSVAYYFSGNVEKGSMFNAKSLELAEKSGDERALAYAYNHHANGLLIKASRDRTNQVLVGENLQSAKIFNDKSFEIAKRIKDWLLQGYYHRVEGDILNLKGEYAVSIEKSVLAVDCFKKIHCYPTITEELLQVGMKYLNLKENKEAIRFFNEALLYATRINNASFKKDALKLLAKTNEDLRLMPEAIDYYGRYIKLSDSLKHVENNIGVYVAERQYEVISLRNNVEQLSNKNVVQASMIREKQQDNLILLIGITCFIAISLLSTLYLRGKKQSMMQKNELQQKRITELVNEKHILAIESLLKGQEEERKRIAREMHDGLGGILSSVKHALNSLKPEVAIEMESYPTFRKCLYLIDYSIVELRRIAHNMMPDAVHRFGLKDALLDYCENLSNDQLKISFIPIGMEPFNKDKEIEIYRIIQELISNSIKHARANRILVQLVKEADVMTITVEDNGVGFDSSTLASNKGAGWTNIYNRAHFLGATVELSSEPGLGTTVIIEFKE
jgi:two-component system, NarL family, sensor kinase